MKLEIGPSRQRIWPDCDTLDTVNRPWVKYVAKWGHEPLPFADETYEAVYASHVLEHITWHKTQSALKEVWRILKWGGTFDVWVPDFAVIVQAYHENRLGDDWTPHNPDKDPMLWVQGRLFCGHDGGDENLHRACFDWPYLERALEQAGFEAVERLASPPQRQQVNHQKINLGARAYK